MWYVPYLFGASDERKAEYARMYAGTHHILPDRDGNPRPNLLHVYFHVLFVITLVVSVLVWLQSR